MNNYCEVLHDHDPTACLPACPTAYRQWLIQWTTSHRVIAPILDIGRSAETFMLAIFIGTILLEPSSD